MNEPQDSQGLLSPFLRNVRLKAVASQIPKKSNVLDLACGSGQLGQHLLEGCRYWGVDRTNADIEETRFYRFFKMDLTKKLEIERLEGELSGSIDVITVIAFLEHIRDYNRFMINISRLVKKGGLIIGTTPHPRGRKFHDLLSLIGICSREAGEEHETFLNRDDLVNVGKSSKMDLILYKTFLFGLNQLFVYKRIA